MKNKTATDMTQGNSMRQIIEFTIPLILGNVFQLTYNTVDTIVVGQFAGNEALAAVGTCDPVMSLLILGVSGICVGASVIMSNFLGAGKTTELKKELQTTVNIGMIFALVVLAAGLVSSEWILRLLQTPQAIMHDSCVYLKVIFAGMPFTCLYNIYAAGLRSIGDSSTPVRYLVISCLLNIFCDILFVAGFGWGVLGAGLATVLAQAVSAVLCVWYVFRYVPVLRYAEEPEREAADAGKGRSRLRAFFRIEKEYAAKTITYGGLSALQQCAQPIGKLCIQSSINSLGSVATIAAFNAIGKIEDIGLLPGRSISDAIMTFVAQNEGAGNRERSAKGYRQGIFLEIISGLFVCLILLGFVDVLMHLFTADPEIIEEGRQYFRIMAFIYWLPCTTNGHQGYFRGIGAMKTVLCGTLTQITVRVIVTAVLVPVIGVSGVGIACIAGWFLQSCWQIPYGIYRRKL